MELQRKRRGVANSVTDNYEHEFKLQSPSLRAEAKPPVGNGSGRVDALWSSIVGIGAALSTGRFFVAVDSGRVRRLGPGFVRSSPAPGPQPMSAVPPAPAAVDGPAPPAPMVSVQPPAVSCEGGYWIASSWRCRQTAPHACNCGGDLDYYYRGADGSTQSLNRDAFHASLAPGSPVCIVVHGSFINWKGLCDDCEPVFRWIPQCGPLTAAHGPLLHVAQFRTHHGRAAFGRRHLGQAGQFQ